MSSSFTLLQVFIVVLVMVTLTTTTKAPQSVEQPSQSYNDEVRIIICKISSHSIVNSYQQRSTPVLADHHQTVDDSKQAALPDDEDLSTSDSDEEYNNNYHQHHHNQAIWPQVVSKRYAKKLSHTGSSSINGGDGRVWAIPYRFGKRAAMPYRFGKRAAAMHFRLGKKSAGL